MIDAQGNRDAALTSGDLTVRRALPADQPGILDLVRLALFGDVEHAGNEELFAWKHSANPFGTSPAWVAVDGDRVVGFRTFMRWRFNTPQGPVNAVRAVDTATHPDYQGRGIFTLLTRLALEELQSEGIAFVFNTPNDNSRPGYLKMGWQPIGQLPTGLLPGSLTSVPRIAAARVPAELWSTPSCAGDPAPDVLADQPAVASLLSTIPGTGGLVTDRTPAYLQWRFGLDRLAYRAILAGANVEDGLLLFRTRRRGPALELAAGDLLLPEPSARLAIKLLRAALRKSGADYALGLRCLGRQGLVPVPRQGPLLTWRALGSDSPPPLSDWQLSLSDIELF